MSAPMSLDLEAEVTELFKAKMREFAAFCAEHWQMSETDLAERIKQPENPAGFLEGYNAALRDGVDGALDFWLDEMGYI